MRKIKPSKKMSLNTQTVRNLTSNELTMVGGQLGRISGVACYASDLSALFGITTTGTVCPND
jgi:hypothetical protein